ncbi:proteasome subunit beta type-7-B-like protein [Tanacetum coccineum]
MRGRQNRVKRSSYAQVMVKTVDRYDVMNIDGLLSDEETPTSSDSAGSSVSDIGSADNCFWYDLLSAYNGRGDRADPSTWPEAEVVMREAGNPGMTDEENSVILGADTRATEGPIVADKNYEKIHCMAPNTYCCGVGTAVSGTLLVTQRQLSAEAYHTGRESRVVTTLTLLKPHLFRYQGHVSAYFKDEVLELESSALK